MGVPMTQPDTFGKGGRTVTVTPLLAFLAGGHAEAIARIWPAPHGDFLALPTARRHAAAILSGRPSMPGAHIAWLVTRARDGELAVDVFGGYPPGGLMKALSRAGEVLWPAEQYVRLLSVFAEPAGSVLIRHMKQIDGGILDVVAALPVPLRQAGIVSRLGTDMSAADDLVAAWVFALSVQGEGAAPAIAQRWGRASDKAALFDMARQSVHPPVFGRAAPLPALPASFEPVCRFDDLSKTALAFRNCLRDFAGELALGRMAVFVWHGEGGPAAVALRRDPAGWRLAEARGRDNLDLADAPLLEIVTAVKGAGVRTGESWGSIVRRLEDRVNGAVAPAPRPADVPNGWRYALCLGNLWD